MRLRPTLPLAGLLALVALHGACASPGDSSSAIAFSTEDSAGVRIARNEGDPARLDSMRLELVEVLRIGVVDGEEPYQFDQVNGVTVTDDGRIFVVNGGTSTIRVFDANGQFLREFGGKGGGPAEFRFLGDVIVHGDTVAAAGSDKVAVFDTLGGFRTSWSTRRAMPATASRGELRGSASVYLWDRDSLGWLGHVQRYDWSREYEIGKAYQDTMEFARYDIMTGQSDGEVVHRSPRGLPRYAIAERGEGALIERIWELHPVLAEGPDGLMYSSDGLTYSIDVHDREGRLVRRITRAHQPATITEQDVAAYLDSMKAIIDDPDRRFFPGERERLRKKYLEQQPALGHPPSLQAIGAIAVLADGSFSVLRSDLHTTAREESYRRNPFDWLDQRIPPRQWDHFGPDGRYRGAVVLPASFSLRHRAGDRITGVLRDSLDVEYVVQFEVRR